jgi:hypothetical protein
VEPSLDAAYLGVPASGIRLHPGKPAQVDAILRRFVS